MLHWEEVLLFASHQPVLTIYLQHTPRTLNLFINKRIFRIRRK